MLFSISLFCLTQAVEGKDRLIAEDINSKIAQFDIDTATLKDVILAFGTPIDYRWGNQIYKKNNLPEKYIISYPNGFQVLIINDHIGEFRHESSSDYVFMDKIQIGSSVDDVIITVGQPKETVVGKANQFQDNVLYKDIDGREGICYYGKKEYNVRFFFFNNKVSSIYTISSRQSNNKSEGSSQTIGSISSVNKYDDVRWKDMSSLDLSSRENLIPTLIFNQKTVWPEQAKLPSKSNPSKIITDAMNPGLGVRELHRHGITGKGVNVAIIDQPLYQDHPEFVGKIASYYDVGCGGNESSMHGPAVTSLLVGKKCGTAPDAKVYYAAAPSWTKDASYYYKAMDWIIKQNKKLPASNKIRVVSVSAAPSGKGSPFTKNNKSWDRVCRRAEAAGILVLDCTSHRGFIEKCWYDPTDPENVAKCVPGQPGLDFYHSSGDIHVPSSIRTLAEEYNKGDYGHTYYGRGGTSWTIPYCAGVLAMGWQINPGLSFKQMHQLLFKSAYTKDNGAKIIDPKNFILLVREAKDLSGK
jgi:hypothetical protein